MSSARIKTKLEIERERERERTGEVNEEIQESVHGVRRTSWTHYIAA